MSRSVSKPLAGSATQRAIGAFFIVDPERHSVVMPKIELGQIPMQMMLGHVVVDADDAALEHAEIAFRGVGVPEGGANVLLGRMIHGAMPGKLASDARIDGALVGHDGGGFVYVRDDDWLQGLAGYIRNVKAANAPIALDQRQNRALLRNVIFPITRLAADVGLIDFDDLICAAERAGIVNSEVRHSLANAVRQEPSGLQGHAENSAELVSAHSFFGRAQQVHRLQPDMQLDVAGLKDGSNLHGEGLAASVAFVNTDAGAIAFQRSRAIQNAAMRAWAPVCPQTRFDEPIGGFFAMEMCGRTDGRHGVSS